MRALPGTLIIIIAVIAVMLTVIALQARHHIAGSSTEPNAPGNELGASTVTSTTSATRKASIPPGTYIVILGDPRCPHCRAMERFFEEYSAEAGVKAFFCSVLNRVCADAFWKLYQVGATQGVPTIVACRGNRVGFIEVGELENSKWWSAKLASMSPVVAGKVPVYIAGSLYREVEIDKALTMELCNTTLAYSKPIG